jgi:hypothetical protein
MKKLEWNEILLPLLTLAAQLEAEGQYNLAKLARSTADALSRQAAYLQMTQNGRPELASEIRKMMDSLSNLGVSGEVISAFEHGADAITQGRLPLIHEIPHPHVCRTCGCLILGEVTDNCPTCGAWPETFQEFSPIYWLDALDPRAAQEKLRQTSLDVTSLLEGLSEQAMTQQPEDGGWAIRNIISHLRDAQGVLDFRLDLFAKEEHPVLESKAIFEWATREEEQPPNTLEIFDTYKTARAKILARLESLSFAEWWRTGQHEEFGTVTLRQQVSYFASHEITHLSQIELLRRQIAGGDIL